MPELIVTGDVAAPAERVWERLVDWDRQGEWMLRTEVRATAQGGRGVGGGIEAFTGVGPVGFLDRMVVTQWDPPRRCVVRHTGRLVRGAGAFEVEPLGSDRSRLVWTEWIDPPLGALGQLGFALLRPVMRAGLKLSMRRFARQFAQ